MKPPTPISAEAKKATRHIVTMMEDHAKEVIALCQKDKSTQNGYGTLLALLADMKESMPRNMYLASLVHYGYSYITALDVADIMEDRAGFFAAVSMIKEAFSTPEQS